MDAQAPRDPGARKSGPRHLGLTALRLVTLAACLAFALMLATAPPRKPPRVGAIGAGCSYELDTWTGTLTIRPTDGVSGEMARVRDTLPDDLRHAVRSVSVERGVLAPADSGDLFGGLYAAEALDLSGLDTSRVTSAQLMFRSCLSLASLDLSGWNTSRVTDMRFMFVDCPSLASLDLSDWDTSRVKDMGRAFERCVSLASLDVSGWDTSRVRSLRCTFSGCRSLAALDVSAWETSQAEDLRGMFCGCSSLSFLDLSGWDMSGALDVSEMFRSCTGLSRVRLGARFSFRPHELSRSVWLARLPDPPAEPPYGGDWAMEGGSPAMGAIELATRYGPALAGTWVWARGRG